MKLADKIEHISENDVLNAGREKINKFAIDPAMRAEGNSFEAKAVANQSNAISNEAKDIANNTDERLDNVLASEMKDGEVIDSRKPFGKEAYDTLGKRLNATDENIQDVTESVSPINKIFTLENNKINFESKVIYLGFKDTNVKGLTLSAFTSKTSVTSISRSEGIPTSGVSNLQNVYEFRDPSIIRYNGKYLIAVTGKKTNVPGVGFVIYETTNFIDFKGYYINVLESNKFVECWAPEWVEQSDGTYDIAIALGDGSTSADVYGKQVTIMNCYMLDMSGFWGNYTDTTATDTIFEISNEKLKIVEMSSSSLSDKYIDATFIHNNSDKSVMFIKNETTKKIEMFKSESNVHGEGVYNFEQVINIPFDVEGPTIKYDAKNSMYDLYVDDYNRNSIYYLSSSNLLDWSVPTAVDSPVVNLRHGSIFTIENQAESEMMNRITYLNSIYIDDSRIVKNDKFLYKIEEFVHDETLYIPNFVEYFTLSTADTLTISKIVNESGLNRVVNLVVDTSYSTWRNTIILKAGNGILLPNGLTEYTINPTQSKLAENVIPVHLFTDNTARFVNLVAEDTTKLVQTVNLGSSATLSTVTIDINKPFVNIIGSGNINAQVIINSNGILATRELVVNVILQTEATNAQIVIKKGSFVATDYAVTSSGGYNNKIAMLKNLIGTSILYLVN